MIRAGTAVPKLYMDSTRSYKSEMKVVSNQDFPSRTFSKEHATIIYNNDLPDPSPFRIKADRIF